MSMFGGGGLFGKSKKDKKKAAPAADADEG
jgi:hypothetical protein